MKKGFLTLLSSLCVFVAFAQEVESKKLSFSAEQFPVFPKCENLQSAALEKCFYNEVQDKNLIRPRI